MKTFKVLAAALTLSLLCLSLSASGPAGVYAVVERVVLEPNAQAPERIQVWGAFAFVDGGIQNAGGTTSPQRGYLYFAMSGSISDAQKQTIRKEWADLQSVAGTNQAVAFGNYGYIGAFRDNLFVFARPQPGASIGTSEVRIRPASQKVADPTAYATDTGIVKLPATGSHATVVSELRASIKR